jgi:hypothetical protein
MGKYGIYYGNDKKKKKEGFGVEKPCPINLVFQSKEIQGNFLLDKDRVRANDALLIQSNCLTFDGVDDKVLLKANYLYPRNFRLKICGKFDPTSVDYSVMYGNANAVGCVHIEHFNSTTPARGTIIVKPNATTNYAIVISNLFDNTYKELVVEMIEGVLTVYMNGVVVGTQTRTAADFDTPVNVSLGGRYTTSFATKCSLCGCSLYDLVNDEYVFDYAIAEGAGDLLFDRSVNGSNGIMSGFNLATCWTKQDLVHENIKNGIDVWRNNVTPTTLLRVIFNQLGQSIKTQGDAIAGYTWVSRNRAIKGGNNNSETLFDFTNDGANTQIPSDLNAYAFNSTPVNLGVRLFRRSLYDNNDVKIGEDRYCIYASTVDNLGVSIDFPTVVENNYAIIIYSTNNEQSTYTATNVIALTLPEILVILKDKINLQGYYIAEYDGTSEVLYVYNGTRTLYREAVGVVPTSIITLIATTETAEPPSGDCLKRTLAFTNTVLSIMLHFGIVANAINSFFFI